MAITHRFVSSEPDDSDTGAVQPSNWNDSHVLTGPVGIGTTDPGFTLHAIVVTDPGAYVIDAVGTVGANFIGRRANGTVAAKTAVQADEVLVQMTGRGYDGTAWSGDRVALTGRAAENWTPTAQGTYWRFSVRAIGSVDSLEVMRVKHTGLYLAVCGTHADNAAALAAGLIAGDVYKTATGELRIVV